MLNETQQCGWTCKRILPLSEFPVNRARANGRHLYCHDCSRAKSIAYRKGEASRREVKRKRHVNSQQRVLDAIREGHSTEEAIARRLEMHEEVLDGLLAELILDRREVVTKTDGEIRRYFTRAA